LNPLQIVIKKEGYDILDQEDSKKLVSNIKRMDEALHIFRELSSSSCHPPKQAKKPNHEWFVAPGILLSS
jgi:hypothetical protein